MKTNDRNRPLPHKRPSWPAPLSSRSNGIYIIGARDVADFGNVQFYVAIPGYNEPRFYVPIQENVFSYCHKNFDALRPGRLAKYASGMLGAFGLPKYVQNSLAILAKRVS
jgi:type II secretory pathway pseudopilin PulG